MNRTRSRPLLPTIEQDFATSPRNGEWEPLEEIISVYEIFCTEGGENAAYRVCEQCRCVSARVPRQNTD